LYLKEEIREFSFSVSDIFSQIPGMIQKYVALGDGIIFNGISKYFLVGTKNNLYFTMPGCSESI